MRPLVEPGACLSGHATRVLGLSAQAVGFSYIGMGVGSIFASFIGQRISRRIGPGPCLVLGFAVCGVGWLVLAAAPSGGLGVFAGGLEASFGTPTSGNTGVQLVLQDDGNLVIYSQDGRALWNTHTQGK